jgi:hypothetical protein
LTRAIISALKSWRARNRRLPTETGALFAQWIGTPLANELGAPCRDLFGRDRAQFDSIAPLALRLTDDVTDDLAKCRDITCECLGPQGAPFRYRADVFTGGHVRLLYVVQIAAPPAERFVPAVRPEPLIEL